MIRENSKKRREIKRERERERKRSGRIPFREVFLLHVESDFLLLRGLGGLLGRGLRQRGEKMSKTANDFQEKKSEREKGRKEGKGRKREREREREKRENSKRKERERKSEMMDGWNATSPFLPFLPCHPFQQQEQEQQPLVPTQRKKK
jgi:hypothetical protein